MSVLLQTNRSRTLQNDFADSGIKLTLLQEVEIESIDKILQSGFDLIVSSWTLRHLVDPLGTLRRIYNLLSVNGLFLTDSAPFHLEGDAEYIEREISIVGRRLSKNLLTSAGINVLMYLNQSERQYKQFMIQRADKDDLHLPICYSNDLSKALFKNDVGDSGTKILQRQAIFDEGSDQIKRCYHS